MKVHRSRPGRSHTEMRITTQETYVGELYGRGSVDDMGDHHAGRPSIPAPHSPPDGGVMLVGRCGRA